MGLINCSLENLLYESRVGKIRYPVQFKLTLIPSPAGDTDIEILTILYCSTFDIKRILNAKMSVNLF